jgi:hypothetical protein
MEVVNQVGGKIVEAGGPDGKCRFRMPKDTYNDI